MIETEEAKQPYGAQNVVTVSTKIIQAAQYVRMIELKTSLDSSAGDG